MNNVIYSIGIGIGDPELLTLKAVRLFKESDVIVVPQSDALGKSFAREIIKDYADEDKMMMYYFPMNNNKAELDAKYAQLAENIKAELDQGKKVSYVSMGDPTLFSTSNYLTAKLNALDLKVIHIPGINTANATANALGLPLCVKGENFAVYEMPATVERTEELIRQHPTVIFMKVNKKLGILCETVKKMGPKYAYLVKKLGLSEEAIFNLNEGEAPSDNAYLSSAYIRLQN